MILASLLGSGFFGTKAAAAAVFVFGSTIGCGW